jgi:hypothetical protein
MVLPLVLVRVDERDWHIARQALPYTLTGSSKVVYGGRIATVLHKTAIIAKSMATF